MKIFDDIYSPYKLKGNRQPDAEVFEPPVEPAPKIAETPAKEPADINEWLSGYGMQKPEIEEVQNMLKGGSHIVDIVDKIHTPEKRKAEREAQEKRDKSSRKMAALSDLVSGIGGMIAAAGGGIVNPSNKTYSGTVNARAEQLRKEHEDKLQRYNDSYL